jgi:sucrose-6F-phosphate phosphohydrolase
MTQNSMISRWLFVTDVDDTLLGEDSSLAGLASELELKRKEVILVFNSSRPCASVRKTIQTNPLLPKPDFLVGALGTEIEIRPGQIMKEYPQVFDFDWDRERIDALLEQLALQPHPEEFQTQYKASYSVNGQEQYEQVLDLLAGNGIEVKVIYSGRTNLDLIPKNAGKGAAIQYLREMLNITMERVVTAGDSKNDLDMFAYPNKVIVVGNAEPEIKNLKGGHVYQARARHAAGVLEGLRFWEVL